MAAAWGSVIGDRLRTIEAHRSQRSSPAAIKRKAPAGLRPSSLQETANRGPLS
jgi:hypothetical protein